MILHNSLHKLRIYTTNETGRINSPNQPIDLLAPVYYELLLLTELYIHDIVVTSCNRYIVKSQYSCDRILHTFLYFNWIDF